MAAYDSSRFKQNWLMNTEPHGSKIKYSLEMGEKLDEDHLESGLTKSKGCVNSSNACLDPV